MVAYAVGSLEDIVSIILLRAPQYEHILTDDERGVRVSDDSYPGDINFLREFITDDRTVRVMARKKSYEIDCSKVDKEEWSYYSGADIWWNPFGQGTYGIHDLTGLLDGCRDD